MNALALRIPGSGTETGFWLSDYMPPRKDETTPIRFFVPIITKTAMPSSSTSVSIRENYDEYSILDSFVTKLAQSSKDLDPEIYKLVNSNFWDLL
jgi:hypothetical protein